MKGFRTIISCLLAFLVLASSTTFQVSVHRCGGKIQDIALFDKAESCAAEMKMPPCHKQKPCCEDESIVHASEDMKVSTSHIQLTPAFAVTPEPPVVVLAEIIPDNISLTNGHFYDPPIRTQNLVLVHRTLLI